MDEIQKTYLQTADVVFGEIDGKLKIHTTCAVDKQQTYSKLISLLSRINAETNHFETCYSKYKAIAISHVMVGISKDYDEAEKGLGELIATIQRLKRMKARGRYWLTMVIPFLLLFGVFAYYEYGAEYSSMSIEGFGLALKCLVFGVLGGVISATFQLHKMNIDIESPKRGVLTLAASRLFLAAATGFASFYLLKSGIFGMLHPPKNIGGYYTIALIAGFSEHYVPNMLIQISKAKKAESKD